MLICTSNAFPINRNRC
uniref:Uncharacterized protein n=1 Tax=Lepeophtheirus salmonis TaxID=72036 RepID=A0A0K2V4C2_LEPSM